jgi:hypothetical protein
MNSDLPLDTSHPAVRDYLALVRYVCRIVLISHLMHHVSRLQVLTPLSLLMNIATVMVCTLVINPNLGALIL